jgi:hypothetical protein
MICRPLILCLLNCVTESKSVDEELRILHSKPACWPELRVGYFQGVKLASLVTNVMLTTNIKSLPML